MNNVNSTVHNSQLLLSLQPFLLPVCDNMTHYAHIELIFLEFLVLSYCTLHSLNTGYKTKCDVH